MKVAINAHGEALRKLRQERADGLPKAVKVWCVPGKHDGPLIGGPDDPLSLAATARGWRLIPVDLRRGVWVFDPHSPMRVTCCPEHVSLVIGA